MIKANQLGWERLPEPHMRSADLRHIELEKIIVTEEERFAILLTPLKLLMSQHFLWLNMEREGV